LKQERTVLFVAIVYNQILVNIFVLPLCIPSKEAQDKLSYIKS